MGDAAINIATADLLRRDSDAQVEISGRYYEDDRSFYARYHIGTVPPAIPFAPPGHGGFVLRGMQLFLGAFWAILLVLPVTLGFPGLSEALATWSRADGVLDLITSDVVVLAGGGYLFSATRKVNASLIHSLAIIWLAVLSRKPIVMMPQSIGPLRGRFDRWIVKRTLSKVGPIVVREGAAYAEVEQLLHSATTSLVPDVALYGWGAKARRERPRVPTARRRVGIVVMDWTWARAAPPDELTRYVRKLVTLIESLEAHAVDSLLLGGSNLPQANQDDMIVVRRIAELAIERGGRPTIAEMSDPETFRLLLRTLDVVIGTRLHSCLLALASGVPAIALGYQPKSGGTYDLLGIGELCYDVQTFDPVALAEHVTSILATQLEWDERVTRAADNARRTIEDFYAQV